MERYKDFHSRISPCHANTAPRGSELKLNDNGADLNSNWKRTSDRPTDQRWERNATSIPHYRIDAAVRILMRRERGEEEGGEMKWRIPERKGGTEEKRSCRLSRWDADPISLF